MKRKRIIQIIICFVLIILIISVVLLKNKTESIITLDINPSIEINLNKNDKIINVKALNDDAKEIVSENLKGKSLTESFEILISNLIQEGYAIKGNDLDVILYVDGKITNKTVSEQLEFEFGKKEIHTEIVIVENVTKEDRKLAKKYNVSPAKVSYVKSIIQDNENINVDDIVNKSVSELKGTKETGKYCDEGYILEGDWCLKEKERVVAIPGEICPSGYEEYKGKCYEVINATETNNYICNSEFKLVSDKCIREEVYDAKGICEEGEFRDGYCIIQEYYGDAKEYCRLTPSTDLLYNGRCLGRKPTINGKCLGNDKLIKGYCYDTSPNSGYKADWVCPDGSFITNPDGSLMNEDKKCYKESKVKPTSYYCDGDGVLDGKKCKITMVENQIKERICPNEYKPIDDGSRCLNLNKTIKKESGLVCNQENAKLNGNECIIYDMVEAKQY